jgi:hypothetical protein
VLQTALALVLWVLFMFAGDVVSVPASGQASYYGPGVMERVYANRLALGDVDPCGDCVDFVAMRLRSDVGRRVVIWGEWSRVGGWLK